MGVMCSGICIRYKSSTMPNGLKYAQGHKRCSYCGLFMDVENTRCPCCKIILRTKSRRKKQKVSVAYTK